jgi:hypothetical protein
MHIVFCWESQKKKNHWEETDVRWESNIKTLRDWCDWIDLAHDRDQWRALVNTVMNLRVP